MKLTYENTEIEIVDLAGADVVTVSNPGGVTLNPDGSIDLPGDKLP